MSFGSFIAMAAIDKLVFRVSRAFTTLPSIDNGLLCALLLAILALISLPLGFKFGFLQIDVLKESWPKVVKIIAISLLFPAITEELFFRVLLLPHPTENVSTTKLVLWIFISLVAFIVYHPLNAISFFPAGLKTFFNPIFLSLAALLGGACTVAYLQSGSLWLTVVIHWLVVVVWLLLLGGYRKLHE
ncbi:CPBP family intramembrane metalloprotease [Planktothrix sp. FACHB-1355]|uniref:CPBP family intramembrane metalloprotease n=1 Tax=Aerosakkonema funiforme FACHB-1375 TaxID=2949571 RepID=A0A926VF80_9CYAN|nr:MULTISPECIES: CPBP family glutamic-type intramembrane protease [Oscillatoriales]MBD2181424.1 CPBP family intramembrane metalloprotease [Aerosakkonema funiforme FACHB-1375]MBD3557689.1 CPBP family intramembrane metalloprotease [Planktothrix sp. FACHB-1355]